MPIYEYECRQCHHQLEALQSMSAEPLKTCPACDEDSLSKKISAAGFRLSGSGWYETDFKSSNQKNLSGDAAKKADSKNTSTESKSSQSSSNNTAKASTTTSSSSTPAS